MADLVVLERNPLDASGDALRADIQVLETVKDGETVWQADKTDEEESTG